MGTSHKFMKRLKSQKYDRDYGLGPHNKRRDESLELFIAGYPARLSRETQELSAKNTGL